MWIATSKGGNGEGRTSARRKCITPGIFCIESTLTDQDGPHLGRYLPPRHQYTSGGEYSLSADPESSTAQSHQCGGNKAAELRCPKALLEKAFYSTAGDIPVKASREL